MWVYLRDLPNHSVLFDASGGNGISPDEWIAPLSGISCGYAGSIGPDNVANELTKIRSVAGGISFWIDMEGKLRNSEDWFDLDSAGAVLSIVDHQ